MKRLITLCIVLTAVALISAPVFAEVQNVKVSGDVNSAGVYRNNYDLLPASRSDTSTDTTEVGQDSDNNNFLYTQARVRVDADLTDNVSTTIRLLTEYDWCTESYTSGDGDNVDLDLANVTLKEAFYGPLTAIVGRQELRYGSAFVVGDPDTNGTSSDSNLTATDMSLRKSFDAVRGILDYSPLTIDVIFAKINETGSTENSDESLYGVNAAYQFDANDAEVEGYWFLNRDDDGDAPVETADTTSPGHMIHTYGVRGSIVPVDNLNVYGELAFQRGEYDDGSSIASAVERDQEANAYQLGVDYSLGTEWAPVVKAGWTHYSGEGYGNNGDYDAWIPLYEDQTHGVVANYVLSGVNGGQNSNADILNLGASVEPIEDLSISIDYYSFWLDEKLVTTDNTLLSTNGATGYTNLTTPSNYALNADDDLGYEIDVALNYDYTEDVKMGLAAGWFKPGNALEGQNSTDRNEETAIQVLATLDVAF
ncbi:alginate export family protein [Candidatus Omnitrophota bacterium]